MKRIRGYWRQLWEDRFANSNRRFTYYVKEWLGMYETGYDRKRARKLLRKERIELILQKIYLFFM